MSKEIQGGVLHCVGLGIWFTGRTGESCKSSGTTFVLHGKLESRLSSHMGVYAICSKWLDNTYHITISR